MRKAKFLVAGAMILIAAACAKYEIPAPECPEGTAGVSYQNDVQAIFNSKCISCHSGSQSPDLSDGWSYDELVDGGYVPTSTNDVACEYTMYQVFEGTHSGRLTDEELLVILGWMQAGSPDN